MRLGLIGALLLAGIFVPAAEAAPPHELPNSIGIRLVAAPANSRSDPLGRGYVVSRLAPGASIHRRVEVVNGTASVADVAVYPAAAVLRDGQFGFAPGHNANELTSWTSVARPALRLEPGASAFETVTITVPKEASAGERYAVIWAEVSTPARAAHVRLVNRVGVRIYLSVGPGGKPASNFTIGTLTSQRSAAGAPIVFARVHNSGGRTLEIGGSLTLSHGPGGLRAGPFPVELARTLAPGGTEAALVRLDARLPRGPWRAQLTLTSGFLERTTAARITFPLLSTRPLPPSSQRQPFLAWLLLGLAALVALGTFLARRRSSRWRITPNPS